MIDVLTPIWQRILQLSTVGPNEDFFDLGGDSSLALQLFTEIADSCHRELLPVTIYQARTIAALAAFLEEPVAPKFPTLVPLREGTAQPPVFLAHGLGGTVMDFYQTVRHIKTDRPIYGMQARAIDGMDEPLERIEDMAEFHLAAISEMQPEGPYILLGYSLGGLVALEMAQRLLANGKRVGLLAMIDAYPHMRFLSFGQRVRLAARQAMRGLNMFGNSGGSTLYQPPAGVSMTPAMNRVREAAYVALTRYRPRFYSGKIKFVRAAVASGFPADPAAVWAPLTDEIEIETVPGDHLGMIAIHYGELGSVLSRFLTEIIL